jgi:hypothetical protein
VKPDEQFASTVRPYTGPNRRSSPDGCELALKHESILVGDDRNPGVYEQLRRMKWWGGMFGTLAVMGIWALVILTWTSRQ